ncbi:hypothetical protein [Aquifex sp.]
MLKILKLLEEDLNYIKALEVNEDFIFNSGTFLGLPNEDIGRILRASEIILELSSSIPEVFANIVDLLKKGYDPYICMLMAFHAGVTYQKKLAEVVAEKQK